MSFGRRNTTQTTHMQHVTDEDSERFMATLSNLSHGYKNLNTTFFLNTDYRNAQVFDSMHSVNDIILLLDTMIDHRTLPCFQTLITIIDKLGTIQQTYYLNKFYSFILLNCLTATKDRTFLHIRTIKALGRCHDIYHMEMVYNLAVQNHETTELTHTTIMDQAGRARRYDLAVQAFNTYYTTSKKKSSTFAYKSMVIAAGLANNLDDCYTFLNHAINHQAGDASFYATLSTIAKNNGWKELQDSADTLYDKINVTTKMLSHQAAGHATATTQLSTPLHQASGHATTTAKLIKHPHQAAGHATAATQLSTPLHQASGHATAATQPSMPLHQASGHATAATKLNTHPHQAGGHTTTRVKHMSSEHQTMNQASRVRLIPDHKQVYSGAQQTVCPNYSKIANATYAPLIKKGSKLSASAASFVPAPRNTQLVTTHPTQHDTPVAIFTFPIQVISQLIPSPATYLSTSPVTHAPLSPPANTVTELKSHTQMTSTTSPTQHDKGSPKPVGAQQSNLMEVPHLRLPTQYRLFNAPLRELFTPPPTTPLSPSSKPTNPTQPAGY